MKFLLVMILINNTHTRIPYMQFIEGFDLHLSSNSISTQIFSSKKECDETGHAFMRTGGKFGSLEREFECIQIGESK